MEAHLASRCPRSAGLAKSRKPTPSGCRRPQSRRTNCARPPRTSWMPLARSTTRTRPTSEPRSKRCARISVRPRTPVAACQREAPLLATSPSRSHQPLRCFACHLLRCGARETHANLRDRTGAAEGKRRPVPDPGVVGGPDDVSSSPNALFIVSSLQSVTKRCLLAAVAGVACV